MTRITATPENLASLSGGGGVTSHPALTSLTWTSSGHTGTASRIAAFDAGGTAAYLAVGSDVQAHSATLASIAAGTWTGATSITTLGTIATGTWQGTPIASAYIGAHNHAASDITSGVLATARLASSGTASSTTWLRGDQTWSALGTASGSVATKWTKLCADGAYRVDGGPHVASVAKTSDTTLSTTGLTMSGLAIGRYDLVIRLVYTGNATARIKIQLVATNATIRWRVTDRDTGTQTNTESSVLDYPASASEQMLVIEGIVNVTSSTGTVDLHMAQLVSNATATNIAQGTMHLSEKAA